MARLRNWDSLQIAHRQTFVAANHSCIIQKVRGNGETCLGIRAKNGCVIACEKKLTSPLVDPSTIHKVENVNTQVGMTYAGIGPDFYQVLMKARKDAMVYQARYLENITPFMLCK